MILHSSDPLSVWGPRAVDHWPHCYFSLVVFLTYPEVTRWNREQAPFTIKGHEVSTRLSLNVTRMTIIICTDIPERPLLFGVATVI